MYYLPWWTQWTQAIALIVISCLGSWIAFKQVRIAAAKLNLDLYDRRFKVFETARHFIGRFVIEGAFIPEDITKFSAGTADAVFLFDEEVKTYLDALREKAFVYRKKDRQSKNASDDKIGGIVDDMAKMEDELTDEIPRLIEVFKPYLKLGNI
jgi:hypothetical protein